MQEADVFIATLKDSPLYKYGISLNKIYDYMALARPIVFGAKSFNNPVSEAGAGLVVPPEDSRAMANALIDIASMSSGQRADMGRKGRDFASANHDTEVLTKRLERICLEVLEE